MIESELRYQVNELLALCRKITTDHFGHYPMSYISGTAPTQNWRGPLRLYDHILRLRLNGLAKNLAELKQTRTQNIEIPAIQLHRICSPSVLESTIECLSDS